ncbi:MAG: hypothetical protein AAGM67_05565, partial [Bacteroidota bacterium]
MKEEQFLDDIQEIQLLYTLVMSIGMNMDLHAMLQSCLPVFLDKLGCSGIVISRIQQKSLEPPQLDEIIALPLSFCTEETYTTARKELERMVQTKEPLPTIFPQED